MRMMRAVIGGLGVLAIAGCTQNGAAPSMTGPSVLSLSGNLTAPVADFTFSPSDPIMMAPVTFDATATTRLGVRCESACTYVWDFGGEATGSGKTATHRFLAARTYPVTLTVTDASGTTATVTKNVVVVRGDVPTAAFTASPEKAGQFENVTFNGNGSSAAAGRTLSSYRWTFGDGSTGTGVEASHSYSVLGKYTVTLTVTDNAGLSKTASKEVEIVSGVTADFVTSNPDDASLQVIFNAEKSKGSSTGFGTRNEITKYIWHFGDSTSTEEKTSPIVAHTFSREAKYQVTLTVVDSAGRRDTKSEEIDVKD